MFSPPRLLPPGRLLDLLVEPADVGVGDVRDLFEHQLLDLGTRKPLDDETRPRVEQEVIAGTDLLGQERVGDLDHALLVGPTHDERAPAIVEDLPYASGDRVLAFVNGMGGTPLIELYVVYNELNKFLQGKGIAIERRLIGNYITSLEMAGCSITLLKLDDELLRYLLVLHEGEPTAPMSIATRAPRDEDDDADEEED